MSSVVRPVRLVPGALLTLLLCVPSLLADLRGGAPTHPRGGAPTHPRGGAPTQPRAGAPTHPRARADSRPTRPGQ
ncbi:hypothetical protein [Calidifontibacter indicus]|uniref:hypothetical protein n=1 Tax=Calidifontibacter indicus TaxID=419650 RepID=UPI0011C01E7A|nr:hypothetical protein [Calidifontibacter indicus]